MRMARTVRAVTACVLAAVVASPAAAQEEVDVEQLERRVQRLENILDSGQLARLIQQINALEEEIRELRGEIETQGHRLDELRQRQRNLYADMDRRLRALEVAGTSADTGDGGQADEPAPAGAEGADAAAAAEEAAAAAAGDDDDTVGDQAADQARSEDEREAYDAAFELLKEGRYDEAATAFQEFLERHPDGPYADNAQYWLAESRYVTRDFASALEAFRGVTEDYPDSAKVADARLKIGYTLYELDRLDEAREALQRVVSEHPNSAVARLAEERLLKIRREGN